MCWYFDSSNCHCFREKNRKMEQRPTCLCPGVSTHVGAHSSSILWLQGHPALIFLPQDFFPQIKHFNAVAISSSALQYWFSGIQKLELRLFHPLETFLFVPCLFQIPGYLQLAGWRVSSAMASASAIETRRLSLKCLHSLRSQWSYVQWRNQTLFGVFSKEFQICFSLY